jgi:hypothetical protein
VWRSVTDGLARGRLRPVLSLSVLVAVVFGPAIGFDFVRWDDPVNVTHNPLLTEPWSMDLLARLLNGDTALRFKPLPWLLYRGVHAAFGFHPAAWHALSLILHLAAVLMFRTVLKVVLARLRPATPMATRDWLAWAGAAVWAVHPAHVEAACWVTATPYPLLVLCLLGSFWCYSRAMDPILADRFRPNLALSWLLALAAYATYPVGATYALWLMVADIWIFHRAPRTWRVWGETVPWLGRHAMFLAPAVIGVLITWKSSSATPWLYPAPPSLAEVDLLVRLKMGAAMLGSIWTNLLWPFGQTPNNPMLPAWQVDGARIFAMAAATVLLLLSASFGRRRWPGVAAMVFGTTVLALPVLGFGQWPHWAVADRHAYLPHLVPIGALAVLLAAPTATGRATTRTGVGLLAMCVGLAFLGHRQVLIWRNTDTLFSYVEQQPAFTWNPGQQAYIYQLWAAYLQEQDRPEEARAKSQQARRTLQEGTLLAAERAAWAEAVELSRLLEQSFGLPSLLRRERVRWLLTLHRWAEARTDLQQALQEAPDDPEVRKLLKEWQEKAGRSAANHL